MFVGGPCVPPPLHGGGCVDDGDDGILPLRFLGNGLACGGCELGCENVKQIQDSESIPIETMNTNGENGDFGDRDVGGGGGLLVGVSLLVRTDEMNGKVSDGL